MRVERKEFKGIKYEIYYPEDFNKDDKYPVMFHLHGSGSRGINFENFKDSTILDILRNINNSPLSKGICVFPQCHQDSWFDIFNDLIALAEHIYNEPFVDKKRFNGSGISMGGYGIYQLMMSRPELFNKAIVCCGGGMYWNAGRLKDIKIRIFHGALDQAVYVEEAYRMHHQLKENGADVTLKIYEYLGHNCWDATYSSFDNLEWLFE